MARNFKRKSKIGLAITLTAIVLILAIVGGVVGVLSRGFKSLNPNDWVGVERITYKIEQVSDEQVKVKLSAPIGYVLYSGANLASWDTFTGGLSSIDDYLLLSAEPSDVIEVDFGNGEKDEAPTKMTLIYDYVTDAPMTWYTMCTIMRPDMLTSAMKNSYLFITCADGKVTVTDKAPAIKEVTL